MPLIHISPSGGLLTNQFVEAIQQQTFNHPALAPETFCLPGRKPPSPAELERAVGTAWELLVERWDGVERDLPGMDISALRARWILPLFSLLDLDLEYQRADLVLDEDLRFPISHLAHRVDGTAFVPVHTVLPLADGLDARRDGGAGTKRLSPHDLLQRFLNLSPGLLWGVLCDGLRLRLLRDYHHTYTRGYVEFDLQGIFTTRDFAAFRALYRLCHASRFLPMSSAPSPAAAAKRKKSKAEEEEEEEGEVEEPQAVPSTPLEAFYQSALSTGVKVGDDLRKSVREAIETLANGFLTATSYGGAGAAPGLLEKLSADPGGARQLYTDTLHIIYRILFLMFAEQRGMLPGRGSLYLDEFSLTALRTRAERPPAGDDHLDLWERLKITFRMVEKGVPELGVFGYDGALFGQAHMPLLTPVDGHDAPVIHNADLLAAMRALSTVERDGVLQRISYLDLSVEEIGSVYESLLDYSPRIAEHEETITENNKTRTVAPGRFFLDPRGKERKTTGSYYTHPSLVNELIRTALLPVMEDRLRAAVPGWDAEHPERLSPAEREAAAAALLALKVVDPACGSGAFLIAADNAIGLQLAKVRAGDLYPTEEAVRQARRDVLGSCIYGVDLNPMAVELCKVSLWINAAVQDRKLNFLDHHIRCGNSLVGATRALVAKGIPEGAYEPVTGDDKALASAAKAQNKKELSGQLSVMRVIELDQDDHFKLWLELERLAQDDPGEAERRYLALHERSEESAERLAFDLWTAAFFWPHRVAEDPRSEREKARAGIQSRRSTALQPAAPTTQDVYQALATPRLVSAEVKAFTRELARQHRFFHWELEFPEVYGEGRPQGFDVVLGNPPWERIKLQEIEFFAGYDPAIAAAPNAAARKALIEKLSQANPGLWDIYRVALHHSEAASRFLRNSGRYPLTGRGDVNTYQVFAEGDRDLASADGRTGIIVPSGIATDYTNKDFFADLVQSGRIASLYDFENRRKLFPEVDSRMKFCLLTLRGPGAADRGQPAEFAFFLLSVDDLSDPERRFPLSAADFARINPNTRTTPIFRSRTDAALTRKLYEGAPVLVNEETGENPWGVSFQAMFHMTNDSGLFRTREQLTRAGFHLVGNRFEKGEEVWLPLYEAKMINHFDHRYASFANDTRIAILNENEKNDPSAIVLPRYWINRQEKEQRLSTRYLWQIGFRGIARATDVRTGIFTLIPKCGTGNSLPFLLIGDQQNAITRALLPANLCSLAFDYCIRQKVGGINFNFYIVEQLPILGPKQYSQELILNIVPKVLQLIYTSWDMKDFADDVWDEADQALRELFVKQLEMNQRQRSRVSAQPQSEVSLSDKSEGFPYAPFIWNENRRFELRAELDALFFHLYGLHRTELDYILDTFPIMQRNDESKFNEYRTKRLVLEAYDRLEGSDLIPEEARARSRESVIGKGPVFPSAAPAPRPVLPPAPPPAALPARREPEARPPVKAKAEPPAPPPAREEQPALSDFGLYRCEACGKHVMGYNKADHTRDVHGGKAPAYKKLR